MLTRKCSARRLGKNRSLGYLVAGALSQYIVIYRCDRKQSSRKIVRAWNGRKMKLKLTFKVSERAKQTQMCSS